LSRIITLLHQTNVYDKKLVNYAYIKNFFDLKF
jgi:hypothetical protein